MRTYISAASAGLPSKLKPKSISVGSDITTYTFTEAQANMLAAMLMANAVSPLAKGRIQMTLGGGRIGVIRAIKGSVPRRCCVSSKHLDRGS